MSDRADNNRSDDSLQSAEAGRPCAICGRPSLPAFRPFCSKRCADVDLSRWLGGKYRIETNDPGDAPGDDSGDGPGGGPGDGPGDDEYP